MWWTAVNRHKPRQNRHFSLLGVPRQFKSLEVPSIEIWFSSIAHIFQNFVTKFQIFKISAIRILHKKFPILPSQSFSVKISQFIHLIFFRVFFVKKNFDQFFRSSFIKFYFAKDFFKISHFKNFESIFWKIWRNTTGISNWEPWRAFFASFVIFKGVIIRVVLVKGTTNDYF